MDLYFFDLDKTLYAYDFRRRLPALSRLTGVSQYRIGRRWWVDGYEKRAEAGEWPDPEDYLDAFAEVTGGRRLTLDEWADARAAAMTRIAGSIDALARAAELGQVCLLSNNPSVLRAALPRLAPDVSEILDGAVLLSATLGVRKPDPVLFERALAEYETAAENTFFADDNADNVAGARSVGITAHHLEYLDRVPQTDDLRHALEAFAARNR